MLPMNRFNDFLPWADSMETISQLDRIASLFVILHRKYTQRYNKLVY